MEMIEYIKKNLGIKEKINFKAIDMYRFIITVNQEYFGIFDIRRNTFVD